MDTKTQRLLDEAIEAVRKLTDSVNASKRNGTFCGYRYADGSVCIHDVQQCSAAKHAAIENELGLPTTTH